MEPERRHDCDPDRRAADAARRRGELRFAIATGRYEVDSEAVAEAILRAISEQRDRSHTGPGDRV